MRMTAIEPGTPKWHAALGDVRVEFTRVTERLITGPDTPIDLAQSIDDRRRTWAGVCEITVAVDDDVMDTLNSDWISAGIVNDILVEACANAAIHGKAAHVFIDVDWCADEEIMITATNDGSTDDDGAPGMGSGLFDQVAITWSREVVPGGLRLTVQLAVPRIKTSGDRAPTEHSHGQHALVRMRA